MIVPTSEKLIFFGGGDPGAEFKDDIDRFLRWLLSARVSSSPSSSSSSSSSSEEDVITIASAGFDFGAAGLMVAGLILVLLLWALLMWFSR